MPGRLGLLCVPLVTEVRFDQGLEPAAPPLAGVQQEEEEQPQEADKDSTQGGTQDHHVGPALLHCRRDYTVSINRLRVYIGVSVL